MKANIYRNDLKMNRIHPTIDLYTSTGRMNFINPCLQHIPRDFEVSTDKLASDNTLKVEFNEQPGDLLMIQNGELTEEESAFFLDKLNDAPTSSSANCISLRNMFIPSSRNVLLSADYCQLELRIITNLCKDETLIGVFREPANSDVFKLLASKWLNLPVDQIDDVKRQNVKKVIYGIIYGISPKTLAGFFNSTENEASGFIESFKATFPGLKKFIHKQVEDCRAKGYIETIRKRRRYLPNISSLDVKQRSQVNIRLFFIDINFFFF